MFVGRDRELNELERLYKRGGFQMVVLYGRRRVGKTMLAARFADGKPVLAFTAKIQSDAMNLGEFSAKVYERFGLPASTGAFSTWEAAFRFIADQAGDQHLVFIFDEFPYAAQRNASLVSTLQVVVDHYFRTTNIFLILSGSNQGFMEEKVLGAGEGSSGLGEKDPLFGRRTAQIHLMPFGYADAARMLEGAEPRDLVRYYAAFGGTPYYLSLVDPHETYEENVERLYFHKEGLLYEEPFMLLRQELREPAIYSSILDAIAAGANRPQSIANKLGEERTSIAKYLQSLSSMGLIRKSVPFGDDRKHSRRGIYEISEPVFAFWYRFVQKNLDSIELDAGDLVARDLLTSATVPAYEGPWFEKICMQWLVSQAKQGKLPFTPTRFGKWWGTDREAHEQTDIDVVASNERQRKLLVGECKWRNSFNETEAMGALSHRAGLLGGYENTLHVLFSKYAVGEVTRDKGDQTWMFVDADELYA